jgi:hypothetical protein
MRLFRLLGVIRRLVYCRARHFSIGKMLGFAVQVSV